MTGAVDNAAYKSLAVHDLLRGETTGLPTGEEVAGLLRADPASYLSREPSFTPLLPAADPVFGITDLLLS